VFLREPQQKVITAAADYTFLRSPHQDSYSNLYLTKSNFAA